MVVIGLFVKAEFENVTDFHGPEGYNWCLDVRSSPGPPAPPPPPALISPPAPQLIRSEPGAMSQVQRLRGPCLGRASRRSARGLPPPAKGGREREG